MIRFCLSESAKLAVVLAIFLVLWWLLPGDDVQTVDPRDVQVVTSLIGGIVLLMAVAGISMVGLRGGGDA